tara:strand:- start:305 stop:643 length:339 start_codon:yes stop_codon:yes gene_type:complete
MTENCTPDQAVACVPGLSHARLAAFLDADLVVLTDAAGGPAFRPVDLARLELLCDLADLFDLEGDALGVVIELIDELHAARRKLNAMAQAMADEPQDLRRRIGARFVRILTV